MRTPIRHYLIAVSIVALVALIKIPIEAAVGPGPSLLFFVPAVTLAAWLGGAGPGLLAMGLSAAICYYYLPPIGPLRVDNANNRFRLLLFLSQGIMTCILADRLHAANRRAERPRDPVGRGDAPIRDREGVEEAKALLALIVDSSDDAIITKDLEGVITSWNAAAGRLFGYSAEEAIGRPVTLIIPDDRLGEEAEILGRLRRGIRVEHYETVRLRKDGGLIDVSLTVSPVRDAAGRIIGASKIARDITGRKRADDDLRRKSLLLDQAFDPILAWVLGGTITYWNEAARDLYGFTADEALGRASHDFLRTVFPAGVEACEATLRGDGHWEGELRHLTKDRVWVTVDSRMSVVAIPGHAAWVLEANRDVTDRKRAEEALERSAERLEALSRQLLRAQEDERRRIARELHDEVGQALTALKINLQEVIGGREDAPARLEESVAIVDQTLQQIRGMALELRPSLLDDLGLVAALHWYVDRHAQRTGLAGRLVVDPDDIRADPEIETACFRVAQEALTNVARHARATRFSVELLQHSGGLQLVVRDDGIGFDPGAAVEAASRGSSLGLVGMRERVELVGGRIAFVSEPGGGSEVQVDFPEAPITPRSAIGPDEPGGLK
jgi:PAS domain S-box-containing protein